MKLWARRSFVTHLPFPHTIPHPAKNNSCQRVCMCELAANYTRLHLNVWLRWRLELNSNIHQGASASVKSHWLPFFLHVLPPPFASSVFFYSTAASCLKPSVTLRPGSCGCCGCYCWRGTQRRKAMRRKERSYSPQRGRTGVPDGWGRCDFILYSASALHAFPWWLHTIMWGG